MATRDKPDKRLTPLETLIMNVLWDESPVAVKQVQERLTAVKPMAYNTVLTIMRILRDKGFVVSEREGRSDLYRPVVTREDMGRRSLGEVIDSFFSGSAEALVSQLLDGQSLSDEELTAIRSGVGPNSRAQKRRPAMNCGFERTRQPAIRLVWSAKYRTSGTSGLSPSRLPPIADQVASLAPPVMGGRVAQAARLHRNQLALYAIHTVRATRGTQSEYPRILTCRVPNDASSGFSDNCHQVVCRLLQPVGERYCG